MIQLITATIVYTGTHMPSCLHRDMLAQCTLVVYGFARWGILIWTGFKNDMGTEIVSVWKCSSVDVALDATQATSVHNHSSLVRSADVIVDISQLYTQYDSSSRQCAAESKTLKSCGWIITWRWRVVYLELARAASGGLGGDPDLIWWHVPHLLWEQSCQEEKNINMSPLCMIVISVSFCMSIPAE